MIRSASTSTAALLALLALGGGLGCTKQLYADHPCERKDATGCVVEGVSFRGNHTVSSDTLADKIATIASSHALRGAVEHVPLLSLFDRLTVDYEHYDASVVSRDMARIERAYKALGYYEAHARAARVLRKKDRVLVEIAVDEGEPVLIKSVDLAFEGDGAPKGTDVIVSATKIRALSLIPRNKPFEESALDEAKKKIARDLADKGYAYATVRAEVDVDVGAHAAKIALKVELGPPCKLGPITLEGYGELPEPKIRQTLRLREGRPYSLERLEDAQIILGNLGVLSSVDFLPDLSKPGEPKKTTIPVKYRLAPSQLRTFKMGVGFEIGSRIELHGLVGWEDKNLLGGLRTLTIEAKPSLLLYPSNIATIFSQPPRTVLPQIRTSATFKQPGFIERRTNLLLSGATNVYRPVTAQQTNDDKFILGYIEFAGKAGIERSFWRTSSYRRDIVSSAFFLSVQHDQPFSYARLLGLCSETASDKDVLCSSLGPKPFGTIPGIDALTLPFIQAVGTIDYRRGKDGKPNPVEPTSGVYFTSDLQVGLPITGTRDPSTGDRALRVYKDVRLRSEVRGYLSLPKGLVLAGRAVLGFLAPFGYPNSKFPSGCQSVTDPTSTDAATCGTDSQLFQFRGFFSGGPSSNRGYAYGGVGSQAIFPFLSSQASSDPTIPIPVGGFTLWEASLELRIPVGDSFGFVVFTDASNVGDKVWRFDFSAPHLSSGLGIRYKTPVGPLRVDIGVRIPCAQVINAGRPCDDVYNPSPPLDDQGRPKQTYQDQRYGQAGQIFGAPLALSIAFGESF